MRPHTTEIDHQQRQPCGIGRRVAEIDGDRRARRPAIAVAIPIRKPPNAVAKNTAGKYGVKKTSGRIWARPHRAAVDSARQEAAKPMLKSGEGWEIPCQPRRNSSINFVMGHFT